MVSVVACLVLGLTLVAAAGMKLAGGARARAALATYGIVTRARRTPSGRADRGRGGAGRRRRRGQRPRRNAAALLMAGARAAQVGAILGGRTGAPCGCFGAKGTVGKRSAGRAAALAAALALAPILPRDEPTTEGWLAIGLAAALLGLVALAVVVLALAREVGMLRLSVAPRGALEVAHEGPEIGARSALGRLRRGARAGPPRAGGVHVRRLWHLPRAGTRDRRLRQAPERQPAHVRRGRRRRGMGRRGRSRQPVRGRARRRRHGARQGDLQHRRAARVRAGHRRAPPQWCVYEKADSSPTPSPGRVRAAASWPASARR